jgi:hypothetical protein
MRFPYLRYELTTIINLLNTEMDQVEMLWENIKGKFCIYKYVPAQASYSLSKLLLPQV